MYCNDSHSAVHVIVWRTVLFTACFLRLWYTSRSVDYLLHRLIYSLLTIDMIAWSRVSVHKKERRSINRQINLERAPDRPSYASTKTSTDLNISRTLTVVNIPGKNATVIILIIYYIYYLLYLLLYLLFVESDTTMLMRGSSSCGRSINILVVSHYIQIVYSMVYLEILHV